MTWSDDRKFLGFVNNAAGPSGLLDFGVVARFDVIEDIALATDDRRRLRVEFIKHIVVPLKGGRDLLCLQFQGDQLLLGFLLGFLCLQVLLCGRDLPCLPHGRSHRVRGSMSALRFVHLGARLP